MRREKAGSLCLLRHAAVTCKTVVLENPLPMPPMARCWVTTTQSHDAQFPQGSFKCTAVNLASFFFLLFLLAHIHWIVMCSQ